LHWSEHIFIALELVVALDKSLSFHVGVFTSRSMRSCTTIAELKLWLDLGLVMWLDLGLLMWLDLGLVL
jgi:hypothetical protein